MSSCDDPEPAAGTAASIAPVVGDVVGDGVHARVLVVDELDGRCGRPDPLRAAAPRQQRLRKGTHDGRAGLPLCGVDNARTIAPPIDFSPDFSDSVIC